MTPPVDDPKTLRRILANTDALLLDFDGPICKVFAGIPAPVVAQQLRDILAEGGHTQLPDNVRTATDPFDILRYAATLGPDEARYVEAAFRAHEVEAVQSAIPTLNSHELIQAWKRSERNLAIVSNNGAMAVRAYLEIHELNEMVDVISARQGYDFAKLKPSPFLIDRAVLELNCLTSRATLIGDSRSDVLASRRAGVCAIALANKLGKIEKFNVIDPDAIVTNLSQVLVQSS